jgi:tetratricopeptide (TPR) repeat protein
MYTESWLMCILQFRLRAFMIVLALLALALTALAFHLKLIGDLNAFYGPGGVLARKIKADDEALAGKEAVRLGHYVEAEARYRSALDLENSLPEPDVVRDTSGTLVGLADALAIQGRHVEAEPLYRRALEIREKLRENPPVGDSRAWDPWVAEVLERYVSFLRQQGRSLEANKLEARNETEKKMYRRKEKGRKEKGTFLIGGKKGTLLIADATWGIWAQIVCPSCASCRNI